jgi:hypothetical protein
MYGLKDSHKYWQMCLLSSQGGVTIKEMSIARQYLESMAEALQGQPKSDDQNLQMLLMKDLWQGSMAAALCLRCYVSHWIVQKCRYLVENFGKVQFPGGGTRYHFHQADLLPRLLDDAGEVDIEICSPIHPTAKSARFLLQRPARFANEVGERYQPLAYRLIQTFKPDRGMSLKSWTIGHITQQSPDLQKFLKEYNIILRSKWGLLNDTRPSPITLRKILHDYSESHIERFVAILKAYQKVYLKDRMASRRAGVCHPPTPGQYQRMLEEEELRSLPGEAMDEHGLREALEVLAGYIRNHETVPRSIVGEAQTDTENSSPQASSQGLILLEKALAKSLPGALAGRMKQMHANNRKLFPQALYLLYVEGITQGEIAERLGLGGQDRVSKLLGLAKIQAGMPCHMLKAMKVTIPSVVDACQNPDQALVIKT